MFDAILSWAGKPGRRVASESENDSGRRRPRKLLGTKAMGESIRVLRV